MKNHLVIFVAFLIIAAQCVGCRSSASAKEDALEFQQEGEFSQKDLAELKKVQVGVDEYKVTQETKVDDKARVIGLHNEMQTKVAEIKALDEALKTASAEKKITIAAQIAALRKDVETASEQFLAAKSREAMAAKTELLLPKNGKKAPSISKMTGEANAINKRVQGELPKGNNPTFDLYATGRLELQAGAKPGADDNGEIKLMPYTGLNYNGVAGADWEFPIVSGRSSLLLNAEVLYGIKNIFDEEAEFSLTGINAKIKYSEANEAEDTVSSLTLYNHYVIGEERNTDFAGVIAETHFEDTTQVWRNVDIAAGIESNIEDTSTMKTWANLGVAASFVDGHIWAGKIDATAWADNSHEIVWTLAYSNVIQELPLSGDIETKEVAVRQIIGKFEHHRNGPSEDTWEAGSIQWVEGKNTRAGDSSIDVLVHGEWDNEGLRKDGIDVKYMYNVYDKTRVGFKVAGHNLVSDMSKPAYVEGVVFGEHDINPLCFDAEFKATSEQIYAFMAGVNYKVGTDPRKFD